MKLFITCGNLRAGGAERVISILANKFVNQNVNVTIFTWYKTDVFYQIDPRVNICQIPLASGTKGFFGQMRWFRNQVKTEAPDVILGFLAPFNILSRFSTLGLSTPVLLAERNDPYFVSPRYNGFWKIIRNVAYKLADGVLVQTEMNKSHFPSYIRSKSTIIYNPVTFSAEKIGAALQTPKRKEIVSVTRLEKQKNVGMLIDAFATFRKSHPDYSLIVYGEGGERKSLELKIQSLGLSDCISLPGRKSNVHDIIVGASIFAMASDFEGMSNSLIEAMCLGLPCVSTKVSGATDLIQSGVNGIVVGINDTKEMTSALCDLADNATLRYSLGSESSKLYSQLNVDVISEQWLEYIKSFI